MDNQPVVTAQRRRRPRPSERVLQRRRAALISTIYHANKDSDARVAQMPAFMRPMPMADAVDQLIADGHKPAMVQGLSWLLDNPKPPDSLEKYKQKLLNSVSPVDPRSLTDIDLALADLASTVSLGRKSDQPIRIAKALRRVGQSVQEEHTPIPTRFAKAYELLSSQRQDVRRSNFSCEIEFDPETLVTSIQAEVEVTRCALELKVLADPSAWSEESPLFWQRSDLGKYAGGDTFINDQPQPDPGTKIYTDSELFEVINLSWNPFFPLQGNNVLRASHHHVLDGTPLTQNLCTATMDVSLGLSLSTTIGTSQVRGGLDVDSGTVEITNLDDAGTRTRLRATKRVRFTERVLCGFRLGPWINLLAPFFLGPWIATLVYEGAITEPLSNVNAGGSP